MRRTREEAEMATEGRIRVMVVDDHPIMRNGLRDTLEASGRFEVVGQAKDGEEAVRTVEGIAPQVIVMDVLMPNKDGIDACRDIKELLPETQVLMLTASTEEDAVIEAVAAGATGYLQKYSRPEELVEAVLDVAEGRLRIPGKVVREVFAIVRGDRELASRQAAARLTELERETLTLFASGRSYTEIAEARGNSTVTVRNTLYRIQGKLGIKTKQELVVWAVRNALVDDVAVGLDLVPDDS
jgi:DNA-binding NarL/FixJ family response regulator